VQRQNIHPLTMLAAALAIVLAVIGALLPITPVSATIPNRQPWAHNPGSCAAAVEGAVFARSGDSCGGGGTSFDTAQIYGHTLIRDQARAGVPCEAGRTTGTCYRMWYTGFDSGGARRIGYALSPDGSSWTRVVGTAGAGSVLGVGPGGSFDSANASFPSVMRTATGYQMWYTGGNGSVFSIGTATSSDGISWTRVSGPLAEGSVLRPSGVAGSFDQTIVAASRVLHDQASSAAPCEGGRTSGSCYRMWYQGVAGSPFYIGHAVSPDGLSWTRISGSGTGGSVIGQGPAGTFDAANAAVAAVVKDGALYRMWYNAQNSAGAHSIGHVVSTNGVNWVRPVPNNAVWSGANDPGTLSPDNVWAPFVLKEGLTYRLWYNTTTRENSQRVSLASVTPGTALSAVSIGAVGNSYTLSYSAATAIPAGGYVLITLPAEIDFATVTAGALTGFEATATLTADAAAITDASAGNLARGALLVRLPNGDAAGAKSVSFTLAAQPGADAGVTVQSFDSREVLERGSATISGSASTPTPTSTPSNTPTNTAGPSATPSNTPTATNTPSNTNTPTTTNTPTRTASPTPVPSGNNQPWAQVSGPCASGAIFGRSGESCGGGGTSFDINEIFPPSVVRDEASATAPCESGRTSGTCYRMWYVGTENPPLDVRRIGYAVSPDGLSWTRVPGAASGGAVFEGSGVSGSFDNAGVSTMSVIKVGTTFRMYYTGFTNISTIDGIGMAQSTNGTSWTRVAGNLAGGAMLRASGDPNQFDTSYIVAPSLLVDQASTIAPCEGGRTSGTCYRMIFEGVRSSPSYRFRLGLALSPDGISWTRVSNFADGSIIETSPLGAFDDGSIGVPVIIKDGAIYRMWYEANGMSSGYTTGYVVSTDARNWTKASPNGPVWTAAMDSINVGSPDELWAVRVLKEGAAYRLYYTTSTRPSSRRFALAQMTPGTALAGVSAERADTLYTLRFSGGSLPNGGSVLITLPPSIDFATVSAGTLAGFGAGATLSADPAAVTDAVSQGVARGALLVRLPNGAPAGEKTVSFNLSGSVTAGTLALIQSFSTREVLGYAEVALPASTGATPTSTNTPTNTPVNSNTPTSTPVNTNTPTNTPVNTNTPTSTPSNTPLPGSNFALAFAGDNDVAMGGAIAGLGGTQTIELWVRPATANQSSVLASTTNDTSGWALELNNGRVTWWLYTGGQWRSTANTATLAPNTWYHVAVTYNAATSNAQVFVNGVASTATNVGVLSAGPQFSLGGLAGYAFFNGQLDEVRVSNSVRYTGAFTPPSSAFVDDANTLAIFSLDEGSGQSSQERSGNGYTLTLGTGAGVDSADPSWVSSTAPTN